MAIEFIATTYSAGRFKLGPINTEIPEKKITAIMGKNGSGKSTTIRLMHGDIKPLEGRITLDGRDVWKIKPVDLARQMSLVTQEINDPLSFTVKDVMMVSGYARDHDEASMLQALEIFGLTPYLYRDFNFLSGGERRLVTIAASIYQDSDIIIMDEPTNFLDVDNQMLVYQVLRQLRKKGKTIVLAMHDISAVSAISDFVIMLKKGELVDQGPTSSTLTVENLRKVFNVPFKTYETPWGVNFSSPLVSEKEMD
ncbi:ABC transporter ATP-binding protein [Oxyplasma meridianum]|uniref:ABC transporter ATP-binding protein n=1 Tax=Oxyplasma meridianum TaxID=3073602 RepID=A0AAX4NGV6_9ARCH